MSYPYAKYTETFLEFNDNNPTFLTDTFVMYNPDGSVNEDWGNALVAMMKAVYNIYEIAGETEGEQKQFLEDTFNRHKRYYQEMLEAYNKSFDYTTGIIQTRTTTSTDKTSESGADTNTRTPTGTTSVTESTETLGYDLPRTNQTESKPSAKNTDTSTSTTSYDEYKVVDEVGYGHIRDYEHTNSVTLTDNSQYILLKNQYLRQIRDLYAEFAMRFWDCFLHIY